MIQQRTSIWLHPRGAETTTMISGLIQVLRSIGPRSNPPACGLVDSLRTTIALQSAMSGPSPSTSSPRGPFGLWPHIPKGRHTNPGAPRDLRLESLGSSSAHQLACTSPETPSVLQPETLGSSHEHKGHVLYLTRCLSSCWAAGEWD